MRLFREKGQSTAEYAILIGVVIGVLLVVQTYVKRGMQGRFKDSTDDFVYMVEYDETKAGADWTAVTGTSAAIMSDQWEYGKLQSKRTRDVLQDKTHEEMAEGGQITRDTRQRTQQAVGDYQQYDYTLEQQSEE